MTQSKRSETPAIGWGLSILKTQAIAYINGCNIYYGLHRGTPYKWLDLIRR